MSKEGSLEAPTRHTVDWRNPDFYDEAKLDAETRRIFDICHGCRRCFNLCESFPRLFDLIDNGPTGELDGVPKEKYVEVEQACTLCDMCFMTKCPYVPPHEWALDFPHLMLRHRAVQARKNGIGFIESQLADTDRMGRLGTFAAGLVNWATDEKNTLARRAIAGTPFEGLADKLVGPLIYGTSADPVAAARVLNDFAKTNDKLVLKAGALPNSVFDQNGAKALATMPSREELLANLLGTMQAPVATFVRTLNEVPSRFVRTLAAVRDDKEKAAA